MEAINNDGVIFLNQSKYAMKLLLHFRLSKAKPMTTPVIPSSKLSIESGELLQDVTSYGMFVISHTDSFSYLLCSQPSGTISSSSKDSTSSSGKEDFMIC